MKIPSGKLIVIEGIEGAGKSTAVNTVVEWLAQRSIKTLTTREPGGTPIGEILRSVLKNPEFRHVLDDKSELLMMYASRIQLIREVIKPALDEGTWVIADRFELSSLAYQGGGRGLDEQMILELSEFCLEGLKPNLTLYLDIAPELGMQRAASRGTFDRIEEQSIEFFHRVHQTYLKYMDTMPNAVTINASNTLAEVQSALQTALSDFIQSVN